MLSRIFLFITKYQSFSFFMEKCRLHIFTVISIPHAEKSALPKVGRDDFSATTIINKKYLFFRRDCGRFIL